MESESIRRPGQRQAVNTAEDMRRRVKTALVTGGTRGIGRAIAQRLAQCGHRVLVTGTSRGGEGPKGCAYHACDFSDAGAVEAFARAVASWELDVLVNNAGINQVGELATYRTEDFERIQRVNVTAPFVLCRAVVPGMRKRRFGRVVNITSIFGSVSRSGRSAYSASKSGVAGFSRALALEVASDNVLVNCVAPGFVETDLTRRMLGDQGVREMAQSIPVGRLARPEEIAWCVGFLASEENTYLTGQQVIIDGGFTCA